ncbi:MAG TPA: CoA pyrophosphatase [Arenimonas sp.]|nr:CoA pyrophosphatase [Arenimonas sp.]
MTESTIKRLTSSLLNQNQALQSEPINLTELKAFLPQEQKDLIHASVLCALVVRETGLHVLLTKRAEHLRQHAGQISFPGGRIEESDVDPYQAALREAYEEISLKSETVQYLGYLNPMVTITGFIVFPAVALLDPNYHAKPDGNEVTELFEAPLSLFLDKNNEHAFEIEFQGVQRQLQEFRWKHYRIWGATAMMLINLRNRLEQQI